MGCSSSSPEVAAFTYTSHSRIDLMYSEAKETMTVLQREGGHLEVAYDTFFTIMGRPPSVAHAVVALLAAIAADAEWSFPLPFMDSYPGLRISAKNVHRVEVQRAWDLWCRLAREIGFSLEYLEYHLPQVMHCAAVPSLVEKTIGSLSASPDIRAIDLRKLQRVAEINQKVILDSADRLHKAVRKVRDVAEQSITVMTGLREREDLQRQLLAISQAASRDSYLDPAYLSEYYASDISQLVAALPLY